jgi:ParB family chromosome partitioning protein
MENKDMEELLQSVQQNGVLVPVLVRPVGDKYEIISGHRRRFCAEKSGLTQIPCVVRDMTYDDAVLIMVDSNIQRKNILPSEKALAYKMKLNAVKRQGERTDLTSRPVGTKSAEELGKINNDSERNVYRYLRLAELPYSLLNAVDSKKLSLRAAVDLSYLTKEEQAIVENIGKMFNRFPTMDQAAVLKENTESLTEESIGAVILTVDEKVLRPAKWLDEKKVRKYFPQEYSLEEIGEEILKMLETRG